MPDTPSALGDIRVLDLSGQIGAYCGKLLADLGADVIKIEPPGGDPTRRVGPFYKDSGDPAQSLIFYYLNTNKRGVTLDLETEDGRGTFRQLAATADVVIESYPPGYLDGRGLGYEGLRGLREDIIVTSITGFGQFGPHAAYLAPDIVGVAMAGIMWLAGDPEDQPNIPYGTQGFICASIQAAGGTMMALYHRDASGEGQHVDVSMQEALLIAQETAMQTYDLNKSVRRRTGGRTELGFTIPGIGSYETADGWIFAYLGTPGGAPWPEMLRWLEEEGAAEDLGEARHREVVEQLDLRFLTRMAIDKELRAKHVGSMERIEQVISAFFKSKGKWELYERGQQRRLLLGIVSTPEDLAKNPQLAARAWYQDVAHPELGETLRYPGPPYRLSETPWRIERRAPLLGEHNDEVLGELGAGGR